MSSDYDFGNGNNWLVWHLAYVVNDPETAGSIVFVRGNDDPVFFDKVGSDYTARYGVEYTLIHDTGNDVFIVATPAGEEWRLHDGSQNIVYTNYVGQILLKQFNDDSDGWIEYHKFDGDGHEIQAANPSAVLLYNDLFANLAVTLQLLDGFIRVTDYYATTTAAARSTRRTPTRSTAAACKWNSASPRCPPLRRRKTAAVRATRGPSGSTSSAI